MNTIPISTLVIGCNGLIAITLSYIVAIERTKTKIWHGESKQDITTQPNYLENPSPWVKFIESTTQNIVTTKTKDDGILQRKVRAFGNFTEWTPLGLLLLITLELIYSQTWLIWLMGSTLTISRIAHAWGVIQTYGPSPGRAIGFFGTWLVYIISSLACIYYSIQNLI